ncbi:YbaY family lipoprotein [Shewanella olleyana]|uniref:YbaY family lipoprotein n=1 Tax=Shewanella olleyana TaxID=135626 RepID=UPI0020100459|nr:YbaY family lipoprotein [Shewanella olleyana]MCL1066403.1 YbaY family lipoprotein [Shewanella olleyana]
MGKTMKHTLNKLLMPFVLAVALVAALGGCASQSDLVTISGDVMYRERIALPADAVIKVQLKDVSLQDTKAIVMAEMMTDNVKTPHAFEFQLARDQFQSGHTYAVGARIEVDGKLWFINTQSYIVNIDATEPVNVLVNKVGG